MRTIQFGNQTFELRDFWPSSSGNPVQAITSGIDEGSFYLSFPLTDEQKAFLGDTKAQYMRLEVRKV